jgi:hypothetical protein
VRAVFLVLLSSNLLFLAWARWIDSPRDAGAQDSLARLPRLQIVTESPSGTKPTSGNFHSAIPSRAGLVARSLATVSGLATAEKMSFRPVEPAQTCTSVGPFSDIASAARAAGLLTQRGYRLQQRAEEGETIEGYWVFVGGMQSDEDVAQVVGRLGKSGFIDAHIMKNFSTNRRVSVGMFSTRDGAEKRAAAIRNMGLQPEVGERRFPGTIYWVDVTLKRGPGVKQLLPDYLFADIGHAKVAMRPCPALLEPSAPVRAPDDDADGVTWRRPRTTVASAPKLP